MVGVDSENGELSINKFLSLREGLDLLPLHDGYVLVAKRPWTPLAEAALCPLTRDFTMPDDMASYGFEYVLEASVAVEVLDILRGRGATQSDKRSLLLHYAEYDAYPDWALKS